MGGVEFQFRLIIYLLADALSSFIVSMYEMISLFSFLIVIVGNVDQKHVIRDATKATTIVAMTPT